MFHENWNPSLSSSKHCRWSETTCHQKSYWKLY